MEWNKILDLFGLAIGAVTYFLFDFFRNPVGKNQIVIVFRLMIIKVAGPTSKKYPM